MELKVVNMNERYAFQILNWKYDSPYNFYNNEYTKEALEDLVDSSYYALLDKENELFGFFCTGESRNYLLDMPHWSIKKILLIWV